MYVIRMAAIAAVAALVASPLSAGIALAAEPANVTFNGGGLGLLLCGSRPDTSMITVPAEQKVRLTNQLGLAATLSIDGTPNTSVANGETVEVQFHRGPVSIGMVPNCAVANLNSSFQELMVEVTPPSVAPAPPRANPGTTVPAPPKPSTKPPATTTNATTETPAPAGGGGVARGGQDGSPPVPPAADDSLFTELGELPAGTPVPGGATLESPATVINPGGSPRGQKLAGETIPVDKGPIGLLAIIATVCVVGVSVGAIRAIITQRATRAEFA